MPLDFPRPLHDISVNLNGEVCRLHLADLANFEPSAEILPLELVELAVGVLPLMVTYPFVLMGADASLTT